MWETEAAQCRGKDAAPNPVLSLTASPKAGLQPVLPGPHAPRVQAVLLAQGFGEGQVREDVRHIVTGKRQVDLSAGLQDTAPPSGQGARTPHVAPHTWQSQAPSSHIPGSPRPWHQGPSRSPWGRHRPGTAGRCHSRAPCPRSCTPGLGERSTGAGCLDTHPAPLDGSSRCQGLWGPMGPVKSGSVLSAPVLAAEGSWAAHLDVLPPSRVDRGGVCCPLH